MTTPNNPHAHSYSFSKYNQSLSQARLFYRQGAFAKAFDTFIITYKNFNNELNKDDIFVAGQCLINLLENAYENKGYNLSNLEYLGQELDKLVELQVNESSLEMIVGICTPLFDCIENDLKNNEHNIKILAGYRFVLDRASKSTPVPIELDNLLSQLEDSLSESILKKIRRWYVQQLYTLASIHAENEITLLMEFYPTLANKVREKTIELFKRHEQCPKRIIDKLLEKSF